MKTKGLGSEGKGIREGFQAFSKNSECIQTWKSVKGMQHILSECQEICESA